MTGMPHIDVKLDSIPFQTPVRLEHAETGIVVMRTAEGIKAFLDSCPHAGWRLSEGELINGVLECPGHGWEFKAATVSK